MTTDMTQGAANSLQSTLARLGLSHPGTVRTISHGQKPCGCGWQILSNGVIRWLTRCPDHEPMCRTQEDWELELLGEAKR